MKKLLSIGLVLLLGLFVLAGCSKKGVDLKLIEKFIETSKKINENNKIESNINFNMQVQDQVIKGEGEFLGNPKDSLSSVDFNLDVGTNMAIKAYFDKEYVYMGYDFGTGLEWTKSKISDDIKNSTPSNEDIDAKNIKKVLEDLNAYSEDNSIIVELNNKSLKQILKTFNIPITSIPLSDNFKIRLTASLKEEEILIKLEANIKMGEESLIGSLDLSFKKSNKEISIPEEAKNAIQSDSAFAGIPGFSF